MNALSSNQLYPFLKKKYFNEKILCFYYVLILAVFSGIQIFGKGADYSSYHKIFGDYYWRPSTDPFYEIFRNFNDYFFGSALISLFFFNAIIALSIKVFAFKYLCTTYSNFLLCLLFYFFTFFFLHDYVQIRASLSIALFLYSLKYIIRSNFLKYLLMTFLATSCHISAVIMLPFWFFCKLFKKNNYVLILVIAGFMFSVLAAKSGFISKIGALIVNMIKATELNKGSRGIDVMSPFNMKYLALLGLFILFYFIIDKKDKVNCVLYKSFGFGLCFYYYLLPIGFFILSVRFAEFYTCVFIILLANNCRNVKIKEKGFVYCLFFLFTLFYSYAVIKTIGLLNLNARIK